MKDKPGRVNDAIRYLVRRGLNHQIIAQMGMGKGGGMITLDDSLAQLVKTGIVSRDEAAGRASHPDEFESFLR